MAGRLVWVRSLVGVVTVSLVCALLAPLPAHAFELSGGVSVGGFLVGTDPRFVVSPHGGISWRTASGLLFAVRDVFSVVPATNSDGVGVYNQTSIALGYASQSANFSAGPSLSVYSIPACGALWCGRVVGLAPGGHADVNVYFAGPLGVSVNVSVDWVGGASLVLPGGVAALVLIGPVLRWNRS